MQIIWKGQSCFQININSSKNGETKLVIDPFDEKIGLKLPKLEADILLVTHDHFDHNNIKAVEGKPFIISGPGEYEIKGVYIQGISAFHDKSQGKERGRITCYTIETEDGLKICHLGDLGQSELTEEQLDLMADVDILMIPVGGVYTIGSSEAFKIINQIEPKIVIPMHYQIPKLNLKLDGVDKFLKAMGAKNLEPQSKLSIKKKDLGEEETRVVVLKP
jgi:L-ascorbate metabolism protein UlaG (beta-lactamase superfamily)